MSRSSEAWGSPVSARPRTGLVRVDAISATCPVCGRTKFCSVTRDGGMVWCTRRPSAHAHDYGYGTAWVHVLDDAQRASLPEIPAPRPTLERASAEVRDRAYRAALEVLPLEEPHRAALLARGLSAPAIARAGYASLTTGRARAARAMLEAVGDDVRAVPGYVLRERDGQCYPSIGGAGGIAVPVRDLDGRIVALKIRLDQLDAKGRRYGYATSSYCGGAPAESAVHVPIASSSRHIAITEGELKADVITELAGALCLSLPGHGMWRRALPFVEAIAPASVAVLLDNDWRTNAEVARSRALLVAALRAKRLRVHTPEWPHEFKGYDDYLAAKRRGESTT